MTIASQITCILKEFPDGTIATRSTILTDSLLYLGAMAFDILPYFSFTGFIFTVSKFFWC